MATDVYRIHHYIINLLITDLSLTSCQISVMYWLLCCPSSMLVFVIMETSHCKQATALWQPRRSHSTNHMSQYHHMHVTCKLGDVIGLSKLQLMHCNMTVCGHVSVVLRLFQHCFSFTSFSSNVCFKKSNFSRLSSLKVLFMFTHYFGFCYMVTLVDIVVISFLNIANIFKHFREMVTFLAFTFFCHSELFLILTGWLL